MTTLMRTNALTPASPAYVRISAGAIDDRQPTYSVAYTFDSHRDVVQVLAVIHGARLWPAEF